MTITAKEPAIQRLVQELAGRYGTDAFPVEDWREDEPEAIGFTSAADRRLYISVVTEGQQAGQYSVMVESPGLEDSLFIDIWVNRDDVSLPEMVTLFGQLPEITSC